MSFLKGGSELPGPEDQPLPEEERAVLEKLANLVIKYGMTVPAIMFLESVKPLNYIGSQALVFFEPMVQTVFNFRDYETLRSALEKRYSIEILIRIIEEKDAVDVQKQKAVKKWVKAEKKKWKWYQRYLGIAVPKYEVPEEVLNHDKAAPSGDDTAGPDDPTKPSDPR
ncbi:MAG: hypothetical protein KKA42_10730 [candidate division Zixibacteria bacterium]|nr:hypothetical protein [candidate division Zixibacteria bacterium]